MNQISNNMEDIFKKGNRITTNGLNCFEILDANDHYISCKDLLTDDFSIFSKTEHKFEIFDAKVVLVNALKEVMDETEASTKDKQDILNYINSCIDKWL
jgi:hypothetical protein